MQQVQVEIAGHALGIVVGPVQGFRVLLEIDPDEQPAARSRQLRHLPQKLRRLGWLEIADGGARKEHDPLPIARQVRAIQPAAVVGANGVDGEPGMIGRQASGGAE